MKLLLSFVCFILLLFNLVQAGDLPVFSQTPVKLTTHSGLSGSYFNPEFVDLDSDGDIDIVYKGNSPVYFENTGDDVIPFYVRNDSMFDWYSNETSFAYPFHFFD